jgi:hypothetical protein
MRRWNPLAAVAAALIVVVLAPPAQAQERPAFAAELSAGRLVFSDGVSASSLGGAARFYVLPRVSVGPEVAYIQDPSHSHLLVTGNVTWDLVSPRKSRPSRITPFAVLGGGLFQTRERFAGSGIYTSYEGGFTAGGGVRARAGAYVLVGVEARIGWELHTRVNAIVGVQLTRRRPAR